MNSNKSITTIAPAKINLYLHIHKRLPSGYHNLESFIVFLTLYDKIYIEPSVTTNLEITGYPCGSIKDNLIIKIVNYVKHHFNIKNHITIKLEKNIPVGAGLGGGSADTAAVLKALNQLWQLKLTIEEMVAIVTQLGADIPACIYNTSGLMEEIGNKFTPLPINFSLPILLVSDLYSLSTSEVYTNLEPKYYYQTKPITSSLTYNRETFLNYLLQQKNCLTDVAVTLHPPILPIISLLHTTQPVMTRMTGSGSCCFAIYNTEEELKKAYLQIKESYPNYFIKKVNNIIPPSS